MPDNQIFEQINHISLNEQQLLLSVDDFFHQYEKKELLELFWTNKDFINQSVQAAREAIILAMMAVSLDNGVDYKKYVQNGFANEMQQKNIKNIKSWLKLNGLETEVWPEELNQFWNNLRREFFSHLYSSNKDLRQISKISGNTLENRYQYFMDYFK